MLHRSPSIPLEESTSWLASWFFASWVSSKKLCCPCQHGHVGDAHVSTVTTDGSARRSSTKSLARTRKGAPMIDGTEEAAEAEHRLTCKAWTWSSCSYRSHYASRTVRRQHGPKERSRNSSRSWSWSRGMRDRLVGSLQSHRFFDGRYAER